MFLISILIPVIIAIFCFWIYASRLAVEREERNIQNILNSVSQNLELQFSGNEGIRNAFYIHKKVFQEAERLNNPGLYEYYDALARIDIENYYTVTLTKLMHTSATEVRAVVFFPVSGENTAYYLGKDSAKLREISYPGYKDEPWYKEVTEGGADTCYCVSDIPEYMPNKGLGEIYSYVTPLKHIDSHKIIGVVKIDVGKKTLQGILDTLQDSQDVGLMLVQRGNVFAKSSRLGEVKEIEENQVVAGEGTYQTVTKMIPETELEIVYLYSRASIYKELARVILLSLLIVMSGVILAFCCYRYQAKKMVSDVWRITENVWKDSPVKDKAIELLNYLAQPDVTKKIAESAGCKTGLTTSTSEIGEIGTFLEKYADVETFPYFDREYLPSGMWDVMCSTGADILAQKDGAVENAAKTMEQNFNDKYTK